MGYVGNEPSVNFTSFAKQDITGDGGASYTLTHAVANANEIEVFVNNVRQEPTEAYTVSGTALTMTGNVASTDDFYVIYLGKALQTTTPPDGSVTSAKLDTNIAVSGTLDVSGAFTSQGIDDNADATAITIDSSENVGINETSPDKKVHITEGNGDVLRLERSDAFSGTWDIKIGSQATGDFSVVDAVGSTTPFHIDKGAPSNCLNINSNGNLLIDTTADRGRITVHRNTNASATPTVYFSNDGGTGVFASFGNTSGTVIGTIARSGSSTAYNTSSDHRLKENVTADWDATTRIKQLNPVRFNFIADADTTVDGFLAHEVQSVVPEAITGTHNEVDDDGNPVYQGIDQSKLVPLLVKTIQELEARITALENS